MLYPDELFPLVLSCDLFFFIFLSFSLHFSRMFSFVHCHWDVSSAHFSILSQFMICYYFDFPLPLGGRSCWFVLFFPLSPHLSAPSTLLYLLCLLSTASSSSLLLSSQSQSRSLSCSLSLLVSLGWWPGGAERGYSSHSIPYHLLPPSLSPSSPCNIIIKE